MDLEILIKEARPKLKNSSLRSYLITLRKLNNDEIIENLNYLKNTSEIMKIINKFKLPTQRAKLTSL